MYLRLYYYVSGLERGAFIVVVVLYMYATVAFVAETMCIHVGRMSLFQGCPFMERFN